ncbi:hypothetical protein GQ602_002053 [Ophiocordyceps camponoti-floridani]|uniref:OTU domain-containing protein n=1 Tax=Ophiocordyceps camponoti-floridani TaxID=2030778 RepID=A0A8H4Q9S4_9HYPO|nr:hypothetical protein GQ602_007437 [Ophiocordyceps camponoti-floridani]KAF4591754.1 hypothetical protein GQ602_002053 [Ophiocordyceps camponoti-floridani]
MTSSNDTESAEQMQARHRRELKDLQGRITNKKKNASKKTRKGVNAECEELERQLREKHAVELAVVNGEISQEVDDDDHDDDDDDDDDEQQPQTTTEAKITPFEIPTQTQQPPQKKRNRQRDRLARRAAEKNAQAQRAGDEAASMTDHRAVESEAMKKAMEVHGLVEHQVAPDGHCLFSAVADQLAQRSVPLGDHDAPSEPAYRRVRRAAAAYMVENADEFAPFLSEDLDGYAARMRDTAEWGGQLELTALARRYGAEIRVLQPGRIETIGQDEGRTTGRTLWLAYYRHGYGLGEHYNSLRDKTETR